MDGSKDICMGEGEEREDFMGETTEGDGGDCECTDGGIMIVPGITLLFRYEEY